jgi:D-lactate dehydrogenase
MNIAFFGIHDFEKEYLQKSLSKHTCTFYEEHLNKDTAKKAKKADIVSVFINSQVDKEVMKQIPKLKLITSRSTGFDHIDLKEAKKRKIVVCNVPFYGENTVAEHAFALILSLSRNIHRSYVRTIRGDFSIAGLQGFDLKGKTIGITGGGHIGLHVARMAKGFDMNVLIFDVNQQKFLSEVIGFEYVSFEDLLQKSDIISLHVPYNKYTHHLINRKNIKLIKKGALLINTARGGVVETAALLEALDRKILAGAGLDVLEGEQAIIEEREVLYNAHNTKKMMEVACNHILLGRDNVVFTPHIAFYSEQALERILQTTVENINFFISKNPKNLVE